MPKRANILLSIVVVIASLSVAHADDLYGTKGIVPEAVRQGQAWKLLFPCRDRRHRRAPPRRDSQHDSGKCAMAAIR